MNRSICLMIVGVLVALSTFIVPASGQKTDSKDVEFMKEAAMGGMFEVKLGELAQEKANFQDVKGFANRMVTDHSRANKSLMTLANSKNVMLPKELDKKHKDLYEKLAKLQGREFDKEYMRNMVEDHEGDVASFKLAATFVQDSELKAWVNQVIPVITEHLRMAKEIHGKIEKLPK
jgi:putative membrane protein